LLSAHASDDNKHCDQGDDRSHGSSLKARSLILNLGFVKV